MKNNFALIIFSIGIAFLATAKDEVCGHKESDLAQFLGEDHKSKYWMETTQDDGKPLFISLSTKNDRLHLVFFKTKEGVWAEGPAQLCKASPTDKLVIARVSKSELTVGKMAPRIIRWGMSGGAKFKLTPKEKGELRISTMGWGGTFIPTEEKTMGDAIAAVAHENEAQIKPQPNP